MEEEKRIPHEYLCKEDFYEMNRVGSGRKTKICSHCHGTIAIGTSHKVAKFYPEFESYPVHLECEKAFLESLRTDDDKDDDEEE
jgi:hypothetical protein